MLEGHDEECDDVLVMHSLQSYFYVDATRHVVQSPINIEIYKIAKYKNNIPMGMFESVVRLQ